MVCISNVKEFSKCTIFDTSISNKYQIVSSIVGATRLALEKEESDYQTVNQHLKLLLIILPAQLEEKLVVKPIGAGGSCNLT